MPDWTAVASAAAATGLAVLVLWYANAVWSRRRLPPGPLGIPLLGYIPFIPRDYGDTLMSLTRTYGKVFTLRLGSEDVVFVADFELLRTCMQSDLFNYRPGFSYFSSFHLSSLAAWVGREWKEHRKFSLRLFRSLGVGRIEVEERMRGEINLLIQELTAGPPGEAVDVREPIGFAVANVISLLVLGERFARDDPSGRLLNEYFMDHSDSKPSMLGSASNVPLLSRVMRATPWSSSHKVTLLMQRIADFMFDRIAKAKAAASVSGYDDDAPPSTFLQAYLKEMARQDGGKSEFFDENHLFGCAFSFFAAGANTARDFLTWFLVYITSFPDVQSRLREEVDRVIGSQEAPSFLRHKHLMPYTEAVTLEIYRHAPMLPLGLMHAVGDEARLGPYHLRKGTRVVMNLLHLFRDPEYFEDPESFRPERFLSPDGKSFVRDERVIAFGTGKRSCPGEPVAVVEIFLFITSLIQKLEIHAPPGTRYSVHDVKYVFLQRLPAASPICLLFRRRDA